MESREEGMSRRKSQNPLLGHRAFDVVILDDRVLLKDLNGKDLLRFLVLGHQDLRNRQKKPKLHTGSYQHLIKV